MWWIRKDNFNTINLLIHKAYKPLIALKKYYDYLIVK